MVKLIIEGTLPNLNDYTWANRSNKYTGASLKKNAEKMISQYIRLQLQDTHIAGKTFIEFDWYEPNRRRDLDNVCFAKKFILDALVSNEVLECDGWKGVCGFVDRFHVDKDRPRIEVIINEEEKENTDRQGS